MEFTGERYVPSLRGQIYYEHLHRYAIAARFCGGKRVLDIASGEGYGSALLARTAAEVVGVDIDRRSVDHARATYYAANLRFMCGSCSDVPLADGAVDVVASFETIEHVSEHERMLDELRRVLAPGGVLVISSPNKLVYSDGAGFANPFHEKELYFAELRDLLVRRFRHVAFYGQRLTASSVVHPLAGAVSETARWYGGSVDGVAAGLPTLRDPVYFVAVCSDAPLAVDVSSSYLDPDDDLLSDIWNELNVLRSRAALSAAPAQPELTGAAGQLEIVEAEPAALVSELAAADEERTRLAAELAGAGLERARLEGELVAASEARSRLEADVAAYQTAHQKLTREHADARRGFESERNDLQSRRGALEDRLAAEVERAAGHSATIHDLTEELGRERRRANEASADLYEARARIAGLLQQLSDLRAARADLEAEHTVALEGLRARLAAVEDRLGALREENAALGAAVEEAAALRAALEETRRDSVALREVLSSRSWKITAPLRRAFGTTRR